MIVLPGIREITFRYLADDTHRGISFTFREMTLRDEMRLKEESIDERMVKGDIDALMEALILQMVSASRRRLEEIPVKEYDKKGKEKEKAPPLTPEKKLLYFCGGDVWQAVAALNKLRGIDEKETAEFIEKAKAGEKVLGIDGQKKKMLTILELMTPPTS